MKIGGVRVAKKTPLSLNKWVSMDSFHMRGRERQYVLQLFCSYTVLFGR